MRKWFETNKYTYFAPTHIPIGDALQHGLVTIMPTVYKCEVCNDWGFIKRKNERGIYVDINCPKDCGGKRRPK